MTHGERWLRFYGRSDVAAAIRNNEKAAFDQLFATYW
jgi:hypothetical protein